MTTLSITKKQGGVLKALASATKKTHPNGMTVGDILATKLVKGAPSNEAASIYPIVRNLRDQDYVEETMTHEGINGRGNRYAYAITAAGRRAAKHA